MFSIALALIRMLKLHRNKQSLKFILLCLIIQLISLNIFGGVILYQHNIIAGKRFYPENTTRGLLSLHLF
jgi:hypothetical protein